MQKASGALATARDLGDPLEADAEAAAKRGDYDEAIRKLRAVLGLWQLAVEAARQEE